MSLINGCFNRIKQDSQGVLLVLFISFPFTLFAAESRVESTPPSVNSELINTLRVLQKTQDYDTAFKAVLALDETMDRIIALGSEQVGEDYFKASLLKSGLEIPLIEKTLDSDACFRAKISFQADFRLMDDHGDALPFEEYPDMVKEAYAILFRLCELY